MRAQREIVAAAAIPILAATIIWAPSWAFLAILWMATVVAADEFLNLARAADFEVGRRLPLVLVGAVLAASWIRGVEGLTVSVIAAMLVLPTARLASRSSPLGSLGGVAGECLAVTYLGTTAACLGWLRLWPGETQGVRLLIFYLACIWVGDSGAYYVGRRFGRHKMSPQISPKKTYEGLAGGIVATYAAAAGSAFVLDPGIPPVHLAALATILAVAAPLGDLVESQFKRDSGIKDSSQLLPGHGGFLDRTDSLLYAAPLVLGYLLLTGVIA
jgi:phosphatidate cytidylyltransferase